MQYDVQIGLKQNSSKLINQIFLEKILSTIIQSFQIFLTICHIFGPQGIIQNDKNLKCPKCHKRGMIIVTLCSNPAKYEVYCTVDKCFSLSYSQRKDPFEQPTQEELDSSFSIVSISAQLIKDAQYLIANTTIWTNQFKQHRDSSSYREAIFAVGKVYGFIQALKSIVTNDEYLMLMANYESELEPNELRREIPRDIKY